MSKPKKRNEGKSIRRAPKKKTKGFVPEGTDPFTLMQRHKRKCAICRHPQRAEIEREYVEWGNAEEIAKRHRLANARALFRHAQAMELHLKRRQRLQSALDRIIERVGEVRVTAGAVVSAVRTQADLSSQGRWVEDAEKVYLNELYERMTSEETEIYAREGKLPDWFLQVLEPGTVLARIFGERKVNRVLGRGTTEAAGEKAAPRHALPASSGSSGDAEEEKEAGEA
jgi:hypothetical protein